MVSNCYVVSTDNVHIGIDFKPTVFRDLCYLRSWFKGSTDCGWSVKCDGSHVLIFAPGRFIV